MNADHFLFGASLNLSAVDCVVRAGTTELFPSGLSVSCVMEADTAGLLSYGPFVDSPDAKSQMAIHIQNGVSVRAAYKAMRKRVRVEARRQRELEDGRPPEVLLESFLELLKHKLRRPPELPKRVLTSAAKAAKHRRVRDKRRSETPCWWIANRKECFKGDWCAFKHSVPQVQGQNASKTGVSSPSLATDRDGNRTKVPLPRPVAESVSRSSVTPEFQNLLQNLFHTCLHRLNSRDLLCLHFVRLRSRSSRRILDVTIGSRFGTNVHPMTVCLTVGATILHVTAVLVPSTNFYIDIGWRSDHWKRDSWHSSHWRTSDWHRKDGSYHGCDGTWNKHHMHGG